MNRQQADAQMAKKLNEAGQPVVTLAQFIQRALELGKHPSWVRRALQELGIRWNYQFTAHDRDEARRISFQGSRERARRQRQFAVCENCNEPMADYQPRICADCLRAAWEARVQ